MTSRSALAQTGAEAAWRSPGRARRVRARGVDGRLPIRRRQPVV